jgi:hypothetical protein
MTQVYSNSPYFDDFDQTKKFYRILFRPGRAVQARELTQVQTILQNQIEQFGKNVYKNGSKISGGEPFFLTGNYIKIQETSEINEFVGKNITGQTSGAKALVKLISNAYTANGNTFPAALHVVYTSGAEFDQNETITINDTSTSVTAQNDNQFIGTTYFVSVNSGIYFIKGHFVYSDPQTVLITKSFLENPSSVVGFNVNETVITSDDDESLLDPAIGVNNYFAPGADRYSIDLVLSSYEYDSNVQGSVSSAVTDNDFIKLINIEDGSIISVNRDTQFNAIEDFVAQRTFDESGDYTVKPFVTKIRDHKFGNVDLCSVELSPGKAYVRGFGFETTSPTFVDLERARDTEFVNGYSLDLTYGRNLSVQNVIGYSNFLESEQVQLFSVRANTVSASNAYVYFNKPFTGNVFHIGNARVHFLSTDNLDSYNLYLFDINLKTGNTFGEVKSFVSANVINGANLVLFSANVVDSSAALSYTTDDTYLFPLPQENIKTFKTGGTSDTTSLSYRGFSTVQFTSSGGWSNATLSLTGTDNWVGSGTLSDSAVNARYYVAVTEAGAPGNAPYLGNVLSFAGGSGDIIIAGQTAKLVFKSGQNFKANVVALVSTSSAASKVKTLTTNNLSFHYTTANTAELKLYKTDVVQVTSITDSANVSYLGFYKLDNGQRDDFYDHGKLIFTGNILSANANVFLDASNPTLNVEFSYYEHSGTGFFNVDSYIDGGTEWGDIPTYTTSAGVPRRLSDVIDYRPVRSNDTDANTFTFVNTSVNSPDDTLTADFYYYLPRKDRLVLTKDRKFVVLKGSPNKTPEAPLELPDAMTLYTFDVPAYTAKPTDVRTIYINNRRYTMRDIGKIEKRVDRIEYYTSLSFLEKIAADERNPSVVPGIDRFKNGILVDSFAGHNVSDVRNPDLKCSIDFENRYMRPRFTTSHVSYSLYTTDSSNYIKEGDIITVNYTPVSLIEQIKATNVVNAAPFDVFNYTGSIKLDPATDVWGDTYTNPAVTVNVNGENDAFTQITLDNTGLSPWGTKWNDWQSVFKGVTDVKVDVSSSVNIENNVKVSSGGKISVVPKATTETTSRTTLTTQESLARSGLQFSSAQKTITSSLGDKVVDSSIIPYIRSKPVKFVGQNLRPDTTMYASFDGVSVTEYCFQASRLQLTNPNINIPTATEIVTLSGATIVSQANVIFQRANIIYYQQNNQTYPFVTGNTVSLITSTGSLAGQVIASLDIADNGDLYTDEYGICAGVFIIPNDPDLKFNMGERAFRLADSTDTKLVTTVAETKYLAYGLSTTKEETILATRMNLVSIDPLLQVKKGASQTSSTTTTNRTTVTGSSNEAALSSSLPAADAGVVNVQTFFCGEQTIQSKGGIGENSFRVNLGTNQGFANVQFTTGAVPDRITVIYNGQTRTSGFISTLFGSSPSSNNGKTLEGYVKRLKALGFPGVSPSNTNNNGIELISFLKQKTAVEYLQVKIEAPLRETQWNVKVLCPSGVVNPSPGTGRLFAETGNMHLLTTDRLTRGKKPVTYSAKTNVNLLYYVENSAKNPRFTLPGTPADKSITITNIELIRKNIRNAKVQGSVSIQLENTNRVNDGTIFPRYKSTDVLSPPNRTGAKIGGGADSIGQGMINSLPKTLTAGTGFDFGVRVIKDPKQVISEHFIIRVTAQGPDGKKVSINDRELKISSAATAPSDPFDPLAQTFFINGNYYEQGVFATSIDLWFRKKGSVAPVLVEIRPVVNGYPSSLEILPFAQVIVNPENINVSTTFNVDNYTTFKFDSPVYLPPGQYCFVVLAQSVDYELYTARIGEFQLDNPTVRVDKQPYIGSLFKSQNASTWTPEQTEDLTFRLNICDFGDTPTATVALNAENPTSNVEFDLINTTGDMLTFPDTSVTQSFKTTTNSTVITDTTYRPYTLGTNYPFESRKVVKSNTGDQLKLKFDLVSLNRYIAPVIDLNRLGSVLVQNIINDPENDGSGIPLNEDLPSNGNADAKYISRRVVLNPGFEAQDIKVYLNAYLPTPSRIKVYFKVNKPGTIDFDGQNNYQELTTVSISGDPTTGFAEHTFSTATGTVFADSSFFSTFAIKIVMLSTDPTQVPIIKDLRALALEAA